MKMDINKSDLSSQKKDAEWLYEMLGTEKYKTASYKTYDLDEGMTVLCESMEEWWKVRYLLNHNTKRAYEFMNSRRELVAVTENDIDWESLEDLPKEAQDCAKMLSAQFPTFIHKFGNGVAVIRWQLNPDGRYYMDDGGFGMTNDEEIEIYGFIDQNAKIVVKFKNIKDNEELKAMKKQAEKLWQLRTI